MTLTRRAALSAAAAVAAGLGLPLRAAGLRKLGLIFPPAGRGVPEEGLALYGSTIEFLVEGLGLATMTPDGYDAVIDKIRPTAAKLAQRGAEAIMLMGTSLSFYKGEAFNQRLTEEMQKASGLPVATMSTAVIDGLKRVQAERVAVATAYNEEVNARLQAFLGEHGFQVLTTKGLGVEKVEDINAVTEPQLIEFCTGVFRSTPSSDSLLVSCGGLRTLEILAPLEERCGVPAVSSTPHALLMGARLLGETGQASGYGTLLAHA